jgi:hypothetical protein
MNPLLAALCFAQDDAASGARVVSALLLAVGLMILYFAPAMAARKKPQYKSVLVLNFFLGWTLVGWVVALAWALKEPEPNRVLVQQQPAAPGPAILCRSCGKYSFPGSAFCSVCGAKLE